LNDENENFGWKPKISVKDVSQGINDVVDTGKQIIDNTLSDVDYIFHNIEDCVEGCGVSIDNIRLRLTHRAIQYISLITGALCKNGLIPGDIIGTVYNTIKDDLEKTNVEPPKILHLKNPKEAIWGINGNVAEPDFNEIDPKIFVADPQREAWVFIHGMLYKALKKDGSDFSSHNQIDAFDYFANFETEAKVFQPNPNAPFPPDTSKIDIYLVSYDSEMKEDDKRIIKRALRTYVLGGGNFHLLIAAVFWREMKRRAEETAEHIKPFLIALEGNHGRAITHSLGCYVLAHASENINKGCNLETSHRSFLSWWCMSAALPSDAFSNTGDFTYAPLIAGGYDGPRYGTSVWYSLCDLVLILLYPLATCTTALGFTGMGVNDNHYAGDLDITSSTDIYHGPDGIYIDRLGSKIREYLGTGSYFN